MHDNIDMLTELSYWTKGIITVVMSFGQEYKQFCQFRQKKVTGNKTTNFSKGSEC